MFLSLYGSAVLPAQKPAIDLERLASCKDSWLDWKDDPVRGPAYAESIRAAFRQQDNEAFVVPISKMTAAGLPVTQVYPGSVGMAVGFSMIVDAPFDRAKKAFEQIIGKPIMKCETGEGMRTCELELGEKKTFTMLADSTGKIKTTLVGCFYFYEK